MTLIGKPAYLALLRLITPKTNETGCRLSQIPMSMVVLSLTQIFYRNLVALNMLVHLTFFKNYCAPIFF